MASMFVPQLVTPVDTSGIAKLGNAIGTLKQDSEIASIMKGIDPYDPNSKQRVISDLRVHGSREARDMADRLEGLDIRRQGANLDQQKFEHAKQFGTSSVYDRSVAAEELRRKRAREDAFSSGVTGLGDLISGGGPTAAPAATTAPTRVKPQGEKDWWDPENLQPDEGGATKPAPATTKPTPVIQPPASSSAPAGTGPAPVGFNEPVPGDPNVRRAGALLGQGAAAVPAPQQVVPQASPAQPPTAPAVRPQAPIPQPQYASSKPTLAPGQAPGPVETQGPLPRAGFSETEGGLTEDTPRQKQLRQAIGRANAQYRNATRPEEVKFLDNFIKSATDQYNAIAEANKENVGARAKAQEKLTEKEIENRSEFVKELSKDTFKANKIGNDLDILERIIKSPNYFGGGAAKELMGYAQIALQANQMMHNATGGKITLQTMFGDKFVEKFQDSTTRLRMTEAITNTLTHEMIGSLGSGVARSDLTFVQERNVKLSDDPNSALKIIAMQKENVRRLREMHAITTQGVNEGRTHTQIQARLRRYGEENRSYINKDGSLTELGRILAPEDAAKEDAERAERARVGERARMAPAEGAGSSRPGSFVPPEPPPEDRAPATGRISEAVRSEEGPARAAGRAVGGILPTQESAREFLRGDNPVANWMRSQGTIGPNVGRAPGVGAGQVPAPQRAGEGIDMNRDMGMESIGGIVNQGTRLAPGGIPWEAYRRSTNIERRPEPNEVPMPLAQQQMTAYDWLQDAERQPVGPLSRAAGLADLEARAYARPGGGVQIPAGLPLPPLPKPKPRRREERR